MRIVLDDDKPPREQIASHLSAALESIGRGDLESAIASIIAAKWGTETLMQFKAARRGQA